MSGPVDTLGGPMDRRALLLVHSPLVGPATWAPTAEVLRVHADLADQRDRQAAVSGRFLRAHPGVPVVKIPAQPADVHDLDGLRAIGTSF